MICNTDSLVTEYETNITWYMKCDVTSLYVTSVVHTCSVHTRLTTVVLHAWKYDWPNCTLWILSTSDIMPITYGIFIVLRDPYGNFSVVESPKFVDQYPPALGFSTIHNVKGYIGRAPPVLYPQSRSPCVVPDLPPAMPISNQSER